MSNAILEQLKANDVRVMSLAKELAVSRRSIYDAIAGEGSRRVRVAIAKKLGKKPSELWESNDNNTRSLDNALFLYGDL